MDNEEICYGCHLKLMTNFETCRRELNVTATSTLEQKKISRTRKLGIVQDLLRDTTCPKKCLNTVMNSITLATKNHDEEEDFLNRRQQNVQALLNGFQRNSEPAPAAYVDDMNWPEVVESLFEKPCRGSLHSCRSDEITDEQLQFLRMPSVVRRVDTASSGAGRGNSCNSIAKFLRPQGNINHNQVTSSTTTVSNGFRTAREELEIMNLKKYGTPNRNGNDGDSSAVSTPTTTAFQNNISGAVKKTLGAARRTVRSNFVSPAATATRAAEKQPTPNSAAATNEISDKRLANIDPELIKKIENEIMHKFEAVDWSDIAGLDYAKSIIKEAVVYPLLRPDIFTGLRRPPRGILLFGPPGTGKTLIGKCIASQSQSTFFSISASSLTSKWIGEGEKMVRTLFAVAAVHQPSVVFIDEIDSLLSQRSESEHESSRRLKTEFLVQLDGAVTSTDDRIVIVGATNRPQELDEAARRRLVRRLYIPLPEMEARSQILKNLLQTLSNNLSVSDVQEIAQLTDGFSGADIDTLCRDASLEPVRSIPIAQIAVFKKDNLRPVEVHDFHTSLRQMRPSVSQKDLQQYTEWNNVYGSGR